MWKWEIPDNHFKIIVQDLSAGGAIAKTLKEIAENKDGLPAAGAHQEYPDVYIIRVNQYRIVYERMPDEKLLLFSGLDDISNRW